MVRQFAYVHEVAGISLLSGEKIQSAATVFHTLSRRRQQQNPNHQNRFLYPAHKIHNELQINIIIKKGNGFHFLLLFSYIQSFCAPLCASIIMGWLWLLMLWSGNFEGGRGTPGKDGAAT